MKETMLTWLEQNPVDSEITLDKVLLFSGYRHNSTPSSVLRQIYVYEMLGWVTVKRKANRKKFVSITKVRNPVPVEAE